MGLLSRILGGGGGDGGRSFSGQLPDGTTYRGEVQSGRSHTEISYGDGRYESHDTVLGEDGVWRWHSPDGQVYEYDGERWR